MKKTFIKARSASDWVTSSVLLISGIVLMSMRASDAITGIGIFISALGLVLFFTLKTGYRDVASKTFYTKREHYFAHGNRNDIMQALQSGHPDSIDYDQEDKGTGLRLDVYFNRKDPKVYMSLYEYKPYRYLPCTEVFAFDSSKGYIQDHHK